MAGYYDPMAGYYDPMASYNYMYGYGSSYPYDLAINNRPFSESLGYSLYGNNPTTTQSQQPTSYSDGQSRSKRETGEDSSEISRSYGTRAYPHVYGHRSYHPSYIKKALGSYVADGINYSRVFDGYTYQDPVNAFQQQGGFVIG